MIKTEGLDLCCVHVSLRMHNPGFHGAITDGGGKREAWFSNGTAQLAIPNWRRKSSRGGGQRCESTLGHLLPGEGRGAEGMVVHEPLGRAWAPHTQLSVLC